MNKSNLSTINKSNLSITNQTSQHQILNKQKSAAEEINMQVKKSIHAIKIENMENKKEQQYKKLSKQQQQLDHLEVAKLKETFQNYCHRKKVNQPPRSKLNQFGVREIISQEPETQTYLSEKQLNQILIDAQVPLHSQTLSFIYKQIKNHKPKGISFQDLIDVLTLPDASLDTQQDYINVFAIYDRNAKGYFDYDDYKFICEGIAKELTQQEITSSFKCFDKDATGKITFNNFVRTMKFIS